MAERTLKKRRGNVPCTLFRPSIIGCSTNEPYPGWIDTLAASGALMMTVSLGLVNYVYGEESNIADIVPVDTCVNGIIACAAYNANKNNFMVVNCGTSHKNPTKWGDVKVATLNYVKTNPFENQVFSPSVNFIANKRVIATKFYFKKELPTNILASYLKKFGS
jgi:hypothetical protein